ncbi:MAG: electron transfer flavoprotein subunit alpha/FixB family protein [Alphaproteobacteria bacterium]|nr:electron transfer flavoprotein subunit alpha/FixB family protein [Alphaproteobacteria bacterium]
MSILVISEHSAGDLKSSTLNCVTAALKLSDDVHLLVGGSDIDNIVQMASQIAGVAKVIGIDTPALDHQLPEVFAPVIAELAKGYSHVLAPASIFGKNILPRVAGLLDVQQISDVMEIISPTTFKRPVYAGNAIATVESKDTIKLMTIRMTAFAPASVSGGSASVESGNSSSLGAEGQSKFIKAELTKSERPELPSSKIVVSGGRGVGSAENFSIIGQLADKLGAAVGASRAAVDAGYISNDYQVGQTGKIVAPQLYIAIGISGAIQHLAGMKDSKVIVAINKDPDAPIFQVADYGLVADLFEAVPELTSKV